MRRSATCRAVERLFTFEMRSAQAAVALEERTV
jgi:hypothetical protein